PTSNATRPYSMFVLLLDAGRMLPGSPTPHMSRHTLVTRAQGPVTLSVLANGAGSRSTDEVRPEPASGSARLPRENPTTRPPGQAGITYRERPWSRKAFARERAPTDRAPTGEGRSAGSAAVFRAPARVGARGERQVVVARLVGDLAADPWRQGEVLVDARQLDLGHHQSRVLAQELVDLPQMPLVADQVPALVDRAAHAQRQQLARIVHRDRVVELL